MPGLGTFLLLFIRFEATAQRVETPRTGLSGAELRVLFAVCGV
jgi:hypothetical protein